MFAASKEYLRISPSSSLSDHIRYVQCTLYEHNPFKPPPLPKSAPCHPHSSSNPIPPFLQPQPPPHPQLPARPTVQLRPHVQKKAQPPPPPSIKINHILDRLPPAPLHHPIVPIERPLVPQPAIHPRPRRQPRAVPLEAPQPRAPARRVRPPRRRRPQLPRAQDLRPRALVDRVVDRHDAADRRGRRGQVFAQQRRVELTLRRVDPVFGGGGVRESACACACSGIGGGWGGG